MPINTETKVLKADEVTTESLNELLNDGYKITEKIRQADGTDSLILTKKGHANLGVEGSSVTETNSTLKHQAGIAQAVENDPRPQSDAGVIHKNLTGANQAAREQKAEMTKTFKKKG
jgi:hypothetical protein